MNNAFSNIKLLILDVDGVLTDGKIYFTPDGGRMVSFHAHDGTGIHAVKSAGVAIAVISGRNDKATQHRLAELPIDRVFLGKSDKLPAFEILLSTLKISAQEVAYVGDDTPDFSVMQKVGLPIAVPNAVDSIKKIAHYCTQKKGGHGAVREVCDLICAAQHS